MINAKTNPQPNDPVADQGAARDSADVPAERHLRMLRELGELAMELARAAQLQALDRIAAERAGTVEPGGDPTLAFTRITRAIRQTVALEARIVEDRQGLAGKSASERDQAAAGEAAAIRGRRDAKHIEVKTRVTDRVRDAYVVAHSRGAPFDLDVMFRGIDEQFVDEDGEDIDFGAIPVNVAAAMICRSLGVTPEDVKDWDAADFEADMVLKMMDEARAASANDPGAQWPEPEAPPSRRPAAGHDPP